MAISLVRQDVIRVTYANGAFWFEYDIKNRILLGKNRGITESIPLAELEKDTRQQGLARIDTVANNTR